MKGVLFVSLCVCFLSGCGHSITFGTSLPTDTSSLSEESSMNSSSESDKSSEAEIPSSSENSVAESSNTASQSQSLPESESETSIDVNLEPPLSEQDLQVPAPDFLTEEQQLLYRRAYKMMIIRIGTYAIDSTDYFPCDTPDTGRSYEDQLIIDGNSYAPALNHYQNWDLFYGTLDSIFSEDFLENEYLSSDGTIYFRPVDGKLYYLPTERGFSAGFSQDTTQMDFVLLQETPAQIDIQVTATYAVDETGSQAFRQAWLDGLVSNTKTYTIVLRQEEGGWRFSQFDVPF